MNIKRLLFFFVFVFFILSGCQTNPFIPQKGTLPVHDMNAVFQDSIRANNRVAAESKKGISSALSEGLMPEMSIDQAKSADNQKQHFNISVNNISAKNFFVSLVKDTTYNMVVDPRLSGTVTLTLKNVDVDDVLNAVHDIYGYQFQKTSYGYQVYPRSIETKVFTVNYLDVKRSGQSELTITGTEMPAYGSKGQTSVGEGTRIKTTIESDFWGDLNTALQAMIGDQPGRKVVIEAKSGSIVVSAYPDELRQIASFLDAIQKTMHRQVIIEAKFLEIQLNHEYQSGVNWSLFGKRFVQHITTIAETAAALTIKPTGTMANVINLLSVQGTVQVLQSPRITTMNNTKAVFKVGVDEYFVTGIRSTTTTAQATSTAQNVDLAPFFSGVSLDVTPQIDANKNVILHIHPTISLVSEENKDITTVSSDAKTGSITLPLAKSKVRESDTFVRVKSGQIIVIGGLMGSNASEDTLGTPFLEKIPLAGALFRGQKQKSEKIELVILLKPTVVDDNDTWSKQITQSKKGINNLKKGFHFGGHSEVFGNEAEFAYRKKVEQKYSK